MRGVAATGEKDSAIRVYFKVKKTGKTAKRQFTAKVKVVEKEPEAPKVTVVKLTGATQKEAKKIAVTFDNKAVTPGAVSAFKVVRTEGNVVIPVKGVVYDDDKTGATIELYNGVTDAKEYTVTYQDTDEAKTESTATFTASDNKVNDIKLKVFKACEYQYFGNEAPGTVLCVKKRIIIKTLDTAIELLEVLYPGKKIMSGQDFSNGQKIFTLNDVLK